VLNIEAIVSVLKKQLYTPSINTELNLPESAVNGPTTKQQMGYNPKIAIVGRLLSESLEQGLVMAPPKACMTNDRSTGVP